MDESLNIALTEVALVTRRQRFILLIGFTLAVNAVVLAQDIRLRLAQKKNEGAIAAFQSALEKDPTSAITNYFWRGLLCVHQERPLGKR